MTFDLFIIDSAAVLFAVLLAVALRGILIHSRAIAEAKDDLEERMLLVGALPVQQVRQGSALVMTLLFVVGAALMAGRLGAMIFLLLLCIAGAFIVPRLILAKISRRRQDQLRKELPDALDMISNSLRAGLTLQQALARNLAKLPGHIAAEMAHVLYDTRLGYSLGMAFDNFGVRQPVQEVRMIVLASKIGVSHGGNLAETYGMLSGLIRDNLAFENELRAMTTEGRMQALVMSCLPFALLLIMLLIQRDTVMRFFTTTQGLVTLMVMTAMQVIAYFWIRKIVDVKV
ncbi:MAG: type II secretion system F family protein [Kiritimatiellia bacterium]